MAVADSVEERMIVVRDRLARGEGSGGAADAEAVNAAARTLMRKAKVDTSAAASTDRLGASELLYLLTAPKAQAAGAAAPGARA